MRFAKNNVYTAVYTAIFKQNKVDKYQPVKHSLFESEVYFYFHVVIHLENENNVCSSQPVRANLF